MISSEMELLQKQGVCKVQGRNNMMMWGWFCCITQPWRNWQWKNLPPPCYRCTESMKSGCTIWQWERCWDIILGSIEEQASLQINLPDPSPVSTWQCGEGFHVPSVFHPHVNNRLFLFIWVPFVVCFYIKWIDLVEKALQLDNYALFYLSSNQYRQLTFCQQFSGLLPYGFLKCLQTYIISQVPAHKDFGN